MLKTLMNIATFSSLVSFSAQIFSIEKNIT